MSKPRTAVTAAAAVVAVGALAVSFIHAATTAKTLYVGPTATLKTPCTSYSQPCQPAKVWALAKPGDTVIFKNGVYRGSDYMIDVSNGGSASLPVTVRAETDGGVRIDGEFLRIPIYVGGNGWVIEGFNAHSSSNAVVYLSDGAEDVVLRRIVAWDAYDTLASVYRLHSQGLLGEDLAGFGVGRKIFSGNKDSDVTCRRCWGRWEGSTTLGPKMAFTMFYNSQNRVCENCVMTWTAGAMPASYTLHDHGPVIPGKENLNGCTQIDQPRGPISSDAADQIADHRLGSRVYGSLVYLPPSATCFSASYGAVSSSSSSGSDHRANDVQIVNSASYIPPQFLTNPSLLLGPGWDTTPRDLVLTDFSGISIKPRSVHADWTQTDVQQAASRTLLADSVYEGKGAHVCYRYVDGVETSAPLFPWPMQQRILDATTLAAASNHQHILSTDCDATTCLGEMVNDPHAIADVMAEIQQVFGPIPPQCMDAGHWVDSDGDGYAPPEDCNDQNSDVHPNAKEINDFIDNDCNGEVDEYNRAPLIGHFTTTSATGTAPLSVGFGCGASDADGDLWTAEIDYGNGGKSDYCFLTAHMYTEPGVYFAVLTVKDKFGGVGKSQIQIKVTE